MTMYTVILAGGNGARLWPLSRAAQPKQFLKFSHNETLLQRVFKRNQFIHDQRTYLVTNIEHTFILNEQLQEINAKNYQLIIEPEAKNTAPAIISAALHIYQNNPHALMLVAPSDTEINPTDQYQAKILLAKELAGQGYYITFGVKPSRPEIGYGYLKQGKEIYNGFYEVKKFMEKPSFHKACQYLVSGGYYWNSGIFLFPVARLLKEIAQFEPKMFHFVKESLSQAKIEKSDIFLAKKPFSLIASNSIDYALMEKTRKVAFIEYDFFWSDMGTWYNVWAAQRKDRDGNVLCNNVVAYNAKNSLVTSLNEKLIALVDVENLSIIDTPDALLVANKNSSQNIKDLVRELVIKKKSEIVHHNIVHRPWGTFENLIKSKNFLVKRIIVRPGHRLSLQFHHHRSEHWVIVQGLAEVTLGNETKIYGENSHIFIPCKQKHRLVNIGHYQLELIETQYGGPLEEDDIVRLDDDYGRK